MLLRGNFINKNKLITKEDPSDHTYNKKAEAHNLAAEKNKELFEKARLDKIHRMQKWQIEKRQQEDYLINMKNQIIRKCRKAHYVS